ncbi:MAG: hypothetical protein MUE51_02210 [Thermoleophilia bacterium]|jgi:hypothetical protein|nr:hypothetical protein [Thermoleophilia bacterium]
MSHTVAIARLEAQAGLRRGWLLGLLVLGLLAILLVAVLAAGESGLEQADEFRAGGSAVLLLGGLAAALGLGAGLANRDADGGWYGLLIGAGGSREAVTAGRLAARGALMLGTLAAWAVALQVASAAIGRGLDGPLAVHSLAMAENLLLVFLATALASTALGPVVSAVVGLIVHVTAQALVNLQAAADQGVVGSVARPVIRFTYLVFPREVTSPMISQMQARDVAGVAAPQFEINQSVVEIPAASGGTVLWTLFWCALLAVGVIAAMRRRPLG